jgi:hypothetical protein
MLSIADLIFFFSSREKWAWNSFFAFNCLKATFSYLQGDILGHLEMNRGWPECPGGDIQRNFDIGVSGQQGPWRMAVWAWVWVKMKGSWTAEPLALPSDLHLQGHLSEVKIKASKLHQRESNTLVCLLRVGGWLTHCVLGLLQPQSLGTFKRRGKTPSENHCVSC